MSLLPHAGWGHPAFLSIYSVPWDRQEILTHQKRREQAAPWCDRTRHRGVKNQSLWCRKLSPLAKSSQPHSQIPVTILLPFHSMEAENFWFPYTDFSQSSHFCQKWFVFLLFFPSVLSCSPKNKSHPLLKPFTSSHCTPCLLKQHAMQNV